MTSHSYITPLAIRSWCISCQPHYNLDVLEAACTAGTSGVSNLYAYRVELTDNSRDMLVLYVTFDRPQPERLVASWCRRYALPCVTIYPKQHPMFTEEDSKRKYIFKQCLKYYTRSGQRMVKKPKASAIRIDGEEVDVNAVDVGTEPTHQVSDTQPSS